MPNRPGNDDRITRADWRPGGNATSNEQRAAERIAATADPASARRRSNRGFASMDREKQTRDREQGRTAAHAKGTAHEFDSGEAREAGRKGGVAVSRNREHMAAIGRRGGEARGQSRGRGAGARRTPAATAALEGSFQNTRGGASADRQVAIDNQNEGVSADTQGNRGGNTSLGGERRPSSGRTTTRQPQRELREPLDSHGTRRIAERASPRTPPSGRS